MEQVVQRVGRCSISGDIQGSSSSVCVPPFPYYSFFFPFFIWVFLILQFTSHIFLYFMLLAFEICPISFYIFYDPLCSDFNWVLLWNSKMLWKPDTLCRSGSLFSAIFPHFHIPEVQQNLICSSRSSFTVHWCFCFFFFSEDNSCFISLSIYLVLQWKTEYEHY